MRDLRWGWGWGLAAVLCACGGAGGPAGPGPWPVDAVRNYSLAQGLGPGLTSVGVDDAYNLWLLNDRNQIGVLRPGTQSAVWRDGVGQAARGFKTSVICGGSEGQAYP